MSSSAENHVGHRDVEGRAHGRVLEERHDKTDAGNLVYNRAGGRSSQGGHSGCCTAVQGSGRDKPAGIKGWSSMVANRTEGGKTG